MFAVKNSHTQKMRVKICCIQSVEEAQQAIRTGGALDEEKLRDFFAAVHRAPASTRGSTATP